MLLTQGQYGLGCVKGIMDVLVANFPERVVCDFMDDVVVQILMNMKQQSVEWFIASLVNMPQSVLNNGEKESFINNLRVKDYANNKEYYNDFFDKFYKRCKTYNAKIY